MKSFCYSIHLMIDCFHLCYAKNYLNATFRLFCFYNNENNYLQHVSSYPDTIVSFVLKYINLRLNSEYETPDSSTTYILINKKCFGCGFTK